MKGSVVVISHGMTYELNKKPNCSHWAPKILLPLLLFLLITMIIMVFYILPLLVFCLWHFLWWFSILSHPLCFCWWHFLFFFSYVYVHGVICDGLLLFPLFYIFSCASASNGYIISLLNVFVLDILFKMGTLFFPFICVFILDVIHDASILPLIICFYSWCWSPIFQWHLWYYPSLPLHFCSWHYL
jgi:hypothetical protein